MSIISLTTQLFPCVPSENKHTDLSINYRGVALWGRFKVNGLDFEHDCASISYLKESLESKAGQGMRSKNILYKSLQILQLNLIPVFLIEPIISKH